MILLVVPNQENENVQKFIREVAEILENSNTFTCIMLIKTDLIYKFIKKTHPEGAFFDSRHPEAELKDSVISRCLRSFRLLRFPHSLRPVPSHSRRHPYRGWLRGESFR